MAGDVASAVQWISSLLVRETIALVQVADQVESLKEELEVMQGYLRDADAMQQKAEVRTLTDQIRKLAYDMEDVIDKYIIKVESRNTKQGYRKWFVKLACFLRNTPNIYLVRQDIESIRSRMKDKREQLNSCGIRGVTEPRAGFRSLSYNRRHSRKKPQSYPLENSHEYIVGLEKDVLGLVKILNGEGDHRTNIVAIVGMGGSGKTTLSKKLYNHPYHVCFDFFAWVVISQKWSTEKILFEILRKSGATVDLNVSKEQLVDQLGLVLKNKSYLVVFDDVWHKQDLEEILPILLQSNSKEGSKIIITTRKREVIDFKHLQKLVYVHEAKPLNDDHAWELFSSIVFNQVSNCNVESFENLGKKMLKKCGGLPLAIIALAGILSSKGSITEWQHVSNSVHTKVMQSRGLTTNDTVEDILALSYEDLPYDLKPCFLYLGVFPEDCQIPTGMLIRMWIAEGLVTAHDDDMSLEDIAMEYLVELGQRFLIQIARKNFMEQIKAIRMHDMLRDLCLKKAKQHGFLKTYTYDHDQVMNYASTSAIQPRRVALHSRISLPTHVSSTRSLVWLARSSNLLSESISQDMPVVDLRVVPQNFELLRLLNIWGVKTCTGTLPTEIGSLIHLRYLGICTTNITKLPKSIGNLRNLLTLDYRYVKSDMDAPIEIPNVLWQLKELRHLFLPIECDWNVKKLKLSTLKKLQTLWGVKEDGGGCWLSKELAGLSETLKKLMIVVSSQRELSDMFCCLSKISNKLDTFHCELRNNLVLKDVEPLSKYERPHKLRLIGRLQMKLSFLLPVNVIVLDLEDSELTEEDPMVTLGELAHLKFLRLSKSCMGTTFTCKAGSFPQLEKLFLHSLQNLNCWIIEEGAMVHLKTLEITRCMKLKDFPIGFAFMKNLEELEFFGMPAEFGEAAIANGWSRKKLRLPHNWESIIERSDSPVDISSVQKIYKQLTDGIYLNNKRQKFWVTKQDEVYYNCFMLYPSDLSLATRVDVDGLPLWNVQVDDWEFGELAESDGDLISEAKLRLPVIHVLDISGRLSVDDLSPNVTYTVTMVIWFDYSQVSVQSMLVLPGCRLETQKINLVERSRSEWVEVPVGEFKARPNLEGASTSFQSSSVGCSASSIMEDTEFRTPLLENSPSSSTSPHSERFSDGDIESEIVPFLPEPDKERSTPLETHEAPSENRRLVSLDVFRGLTIALMILVDDAGGAFPSLNHSPWFGVTIADFVMPFFLFIVGVSIGLVFKKVPNKSGATKKVIMRSVKLFLLGVFLQGGFFHGRKDLTYGVDIEKIRWFGVLQRISIGYLLASISQIWLVKNVAVDSALAFARRYYIQWFSTVLICVVYVSLLYGIYVPSWKYELQAANSSVLISSSQTVECGVRGSLDPPCNAVGFIDRLLLGESHLYQRPVYRRVKECSEKSPDYGPLPANAPGWCLAPFDPEGILSSLMAVVTCFVGLHFGQVIAHFKDHMQRMSLWSMSAFPLVVSGYVLLALGMPLSKPLYTLSYMCITAGASGFMFTIIFYLVDVRNIRKPLILLQWMGMNALVLYALAACEIFPAALQGFYWGSPQNNLVDWTQSFLQHMVRSERWGTLIFVMLEIIFWGLVAGVLHMKRIYIKL